MNNSLVSLGLFALSAATHVLLRKNTEKQREVQAQQAESSRPSQATTMGSNPPRLDTHPNRRIPMAFDNSNLGDDVDEDDADIAAAQAGTCTATGAGTGKGMPRSDSEYSLGLNRSDSVTNLLAPSLNLREVTLCEAGSTLMLAGRVLLCSLILVCCGTYVLGNLRKRRS